MINLRLLRFTMQKYSVSHVVRGARPLLWLGVVTAVASGTLLFLTEAVKCYYNIAFWSKMSLLAAAILFQLSAQRLLMTRLFSQRALSAIAIVSLLLWFGVGIAGRAIAFV
jgi:hypothetical protein